VKRKKFTEEQIIAVLRAHDAGAVEPALPKLGGEQDAPLVGAVFKAEREDCDWSRTSRPILLAV
jgi:hypothetical protein